VVVPHPIVLGSIIDLLIEAGHAFTAEPSATQPGVWHMGIMDESVPLLGAAFGPVQHIHFGDPE
jgi:hypothetical protein